MTLRLCAAWLAFGGYAHATVYIDKQLTTHCGALLLSPDHTAPAEFTRQLRRLDVGTHVDLDYADVETLALPGFDDDAKVGRSEGRLAQLLRDVDRAPEVLSVTFVTRGPGVEAFLARLDRATEALDRDVQRRTAALEMDLRRSLVEVGAATILSGGGCLLAGALPAPLVAVAETAALVGAAYVARGTARRLWDVCVPAHQLDLRRMRLDSHLRVVRDGRIWAPRGRGHIGMSAHVSEELVAELLRARDWTELGGSRWADLLARAPRDPADAGARVLVDHVSIADPDTSETLLLSAVRVVRARPGPRSAPRREREVRRLSLGPAY